MVTLMHFGHEHMLKSLSGLFAGISTANSYFIRLCSGGTGDDAGPCAGRCE